MGQIKYDTNSLRPTNIREVNEPFVHNEGSPNMKQHSHNLDAYKYVEQYHFKANALRTSAHENISTPMESYKYMGLHFEQDKGIAWLKMNAKPRPCFSYELTKEIQHWYDEVTAKPHLYKDVQYIVSGSDVPGIYNLGGDLSLFCELIGNGDRDGLMQYATACNDILYRNHTGINGEITTIALVQGDALGGGFEAAISSEVLIAERSAKMGLPDILFNLFPGAGAYALLSRKVGMVEAERLVLSGRLYTAEEMHELGVVDFLAEDGKGEQAVYDYIKKEGRFRNGYRAFRKAKRCSNPVTYEELLNVASIWVDTAFKLEAKDLRMMERLVKKQTQKVG
ncbi:DSF synthase [Mariprofundus ferrinatatus]|uniref:DSF synthase n=1 Tax=Mariprofundus ferrinatatus TaxID=1921087 RepID=A0A2K8L0V3_9PROT|nr:crotonase/enoyl-CoA hydratase family protein [Mariprofundus ferrinatatus]ATX80945.1 DSF synthase [Mariprofundus ferrinatatus]